MPPDQDFFLKSFLITPENRNSEEARRYIRSRAAAAGHRDTSRQRKTVTPKSSASTPAPAKASTRSKAGAANKPKAKSAHQEDKTSRNILPHPGSQPSTLESAYAYPVPFLPWFPQLVSFLWDWMLTSWSHLTPPTTAYERQQGLAWVKQLTMTEPCYFYMNLLSAAENGGMSSEQQVFLTARVVTSINAALEGGRDPSIGTILTVGRIALREIILGDRDIGIGMHRPAQVRMIRMRGGVENLGLPSLVEKHVWWADRLMTQATGQEGLGTKGVMYSSEDARVLGNYVPTATQKNYTSEQQNG